MSVITVSRQLGSLGGFVAERAARDLGYHLVDKGTLEAMLNEYGIGRFEEFGRMPGFWERMDPEKAGIRHNVLDMAAECMRAIARHGDAVIVGRGGFAVLGELADVLHVRVQAPLQVRIERIRNQPGFIPVERAEAALLENDHDQAAFIKSVYGRRWERADAFDLVLDTGKLAPEAAAQFVVEGALALKRAPRGGPKASELKVDKLIEAIALDVLHCGLAHAG